MTIKKLFFSFGETFIVIEMGKAAIGMNYKTFCITINSLTHPTVGAVGAQ